MLSFLAELTFEKWIIAVIALIGLAAIVSRLIYRGNLSKRVRDLRPVFYKEILNGGKIYAKKSESGCYIITIYNRKPFESSVNKNKRYSEIYVGQSVNIYKRVKNHLTGHGNGDVYADVREGKYVYIRFMPCPEAKMNKLEKSLISLFNATKSYNKTRGGSARRD